ncbi:efflux RND transporter periplasmic adaptor subunit [Rhodoferax sp.]|uniref:efflux RND transporter periplasmic adaptor subunit n=1 Tax=Rhodoferax sp. TaxID=50421 RepID=UPI002626D848|nr:efflux RND transporter periplasmic adaptor subunit [Rhodoferax sp.]MDD2917729.1 efflux RND transporter periplasmic adaptor subunit [Rhodoferax sp.]
MLHLPTVPLSVPNFFNCHALRPSRTASTLGLTLLLAACGQGSAPTTGPGGPGGAPPPAEVGVVTVKTGDVGLLTELPGRLEASRVAQVRARAAGIVQKRLFVEGSSVRAGQALFQIDASPYQATLASAQASQTKAEANLMQASAQAERFKPLIEAKAISQQEFVNAQASQKLAEADVAVARAAVRTARINLGYAAITAPISGRIGRALVTEGALVGQGEATPMAVIQQTDPMYVNFTQPASEVMRLRKAMETGQLQRAGSQAASVRVVLDDGSEYAKPGKLLFSDLTVDTTSGQIMLRAEVPNPAGTLLPGLFVRVRLEQTQVSNAITLPQQAVTRSPQGDSVMVVAADGKVAPRPVKVGAQQGGQWVILDGLQNGDQVMVDGFQKLRGGAPVKPVPWQAPGSAPVKSVSAAATPAAQAPASASSSAAR